MAGTGAGKGLWSRGRRRLLTAFGIAAAAIVLAACSSTSFNQISEAQPSPPPQTAEAPPSPGTITGPFAAVFTARTS